MLIGFGLVVRGFGFRAGVLLVSSLRVFIGWFFGWLEDWWMVIAILVFGCGVAELVVLAGYF